MSKENIVDSDYNRKKVNWVKVDSISIGNVLFENQTAFIGDFEANPILKCMEIDGIIGSNIIKHCNWTIDPKNKTLILFSSIQKKSSEECIVIPFRTDLNTISLLILYSVNQGTKNISIDYGSNDSIALNNEIFNTLQNTNIIGDVFIEKGINQSGIIGKPIELDKRIAYSDSVRINNQELRNVMIRTGKRKFRGTKCRISD